MSSSIAARVAQRFRVAQRYLAARGIPMGKTYQDERVRIHRYREALEITDLTHAGKRGKKCEQMHVRLNANFEGDRDEWLDTTTDSLMNHVARGYDAVKGYIFFLKNEVNKGQVSIDIQPLKSIDVEPFGEIFEFVIKQPGKASIDVKASPTNFRVINHAWMTHPKDPDPSKGFIHDTMYFPRKKKDAMAFYAWMKDNHERARRFMNMDMFRQLWDKLGISYDSH